MRKLTFLTISALALATTVPAFAQDSMAKDGMHTGTMTHMSAADSRHMKSCNAMSHKQMMRSSTCRRLAKMHPDKMHHASAMQPAAPMPSDNKM